MPYPAMMTIYMFYRLSSKTNSSQGHTISNDIYCIKVYTINIGRNRIIFRIISVIILYVKKYQIITFTGVMSTGV